MILTLGVSGHFLQGHQNNVWAPLHLFLCQLNCNTKHFFLIFKLYLCHWKELFCQFVLQLHTIRRQARKGCVPTQYCHPGITEHPNVNKLKHLEVLHRPCFQGEYYGLSTGPVWMVWPYFIYETLYKTHQRNKCFAKVLHIWYISSQTRQVSSFAPDRQ